MPDNILKLFIRLISHLIVLSGYILFSCLLVAQEFEEQPVFEEQEQEEPTAVPENTLDNDEITVTVENNATPEPGEDQSVNSANSTENEGNGVQNNNFDVFQPSEEISEDLAVPFPADI